MAKILVTGGAGFIGSSVSDALIESGHQVVIIDNLSTGFKKNINKKAKFYKIDIRDKKINEIFENEKPDFVNHHAAQMDVRKSIQEPEYDADVNILGSLNIIENCIKYKVKKIIYISTGGAVFGEPVYLPADEKHPINPICHYGISKHTVEHYLFLYNYLYGLNFTVLRYPNVFGPRQNPHGEAGVNAIFIGKMLLNEVPTIYGDGEQLRDYVYIEDIVQANILALAKGDKGIYNIGTKKGVSVNQIYTTLQKILNFHKPANYAPSRPCEINKIFLNGSLVNKELGWSPKISFEEGLRKTVEWFRENRF
ncbi:MAG: NAD-dependent epimerase/dehydratase family protein [Candidatus Firestonebacteria bacterium]|nr:NAD-dependent epimerase/dehydratase family protein [Candidatus Firestonebacteria bacterium]